MFISPMISGSNLVLSGVGHSGGSYRVLVSTNLALPVVNWTHIATNSFDSVTGQFSFTNATDPGNSQLFYRLQSL